MPHFTSCADLGAPDWEAAEGRFCCEPDGRLRFVRAFRNIRSRLVVYLAGDTPADLERRLRGVAPRSAAPVVPAA